MKDVNDFLHKPRRTERKKLAAGGKRKQLKRKMSYVYEDDDLLHPLTNILTGGCLYFILVLSNRV